MHGSTQAFTLLGVLLGALLTWGLTTVTERARFRRDQAVRWSERRHADFAIAGKRTMSILFRVAAGRGLDDQTEPMSMEEAKPMLAEAFHDREAAFEQIRLIGDDDIVNAARAWIPKIYNMRTALERQELTKPEWERLVREANGGRDEYYGVARSSLGAGVAP
jgi:hypothetical protein